MACLHQLEGLKVGTLLKIEIGDFSLLQDGHDYYEASVEFAADSIKAIKELAENLPV